MKKVLLILITIFSMNLFADDNQKIYQNLNDSLFVKKIFQETNCDKILSNDVVTSCYDYNLKGVKLVSYIIDSEIVNKNNLKERGKWYQNKSIPQKYRSHSKDYSRSGYDRGHLAPDSGFDVNKKLLQNTYDINLNSVPMAANVNRRTWIKSEKYMKSIGYKLGKLTVIDVITYDNKPKRIGRNEIAVPKGFYKILNNNKKNFQRCFYYENDLDVVVKGDKLKEHQVDCKEILTILK